MTTEPTFLFAYGTLMRGLPFHALLQGRAEFVATGSVGGRLMDLGGFPGGLPGGDGVIWGEIHRLRSADVLVALDSAEGREFSRRLTPVRLEDGREVRAWVYWFNGAARQAVPIPEGDYRRHQQRAFSREG